MNPTAKHRTMLKELFLGISTYFKAFSFILKHKLWYYFFFPVVLSFLLHTVVGYFIDQTTDSLQLYVEGLLLPDSTTQDSNWWNSILGFMGTWGSWLLKWTLTITFWLLSFKFMKYVVLIFLSPVLAFLSEKTEKIISGVEYPFSWDQLLKDILRGSLLALRNMFIEFGWIFICFIASIFFPVISPFTTIFLILIGYYFLGFSMIDYNLERRKLSSKESVVYVKQHLGLALGNGFVFSSMLLIPIIGVIFAPILGTVAATLAIFEREKIVLRKNNQSTFR